MKRSHPEQIGELVNRLMEENHLDDMMLRQRACYQWIEVVGEGINRYTTRRKVDGTVLHVWLSSAVLKNELLFERQRIVKAINKTLGRDFLTDVIIH